MVAAHQGPAYRQDHKGLPRVAWTRTPSYIDEAGSRQDVASTDVNNYLKEITGKDITAKDFRTWAGTVLAAMSLTELESFDA